MIDAWSTLTSRPPAHQAGPPGEWASIAQQGPELHRTVQNRTLLRLPSHDVQSAGGSGTAEACPTAGYIRRSRPRNRFTFRRVAPEPAQRFCSRQSPVKKVMVISVSEVTSAPGNAARMFRASSRCTLR